MMKYTNVVLMSEDGLVLFYQAASGLIVAVPVAEASRSPEAVERAIAEGMVRLARICEDVLRAR